jgi:predicted MFS family arabinose efflux permease
VNYLGELRDHWRPLLAATLGMAFGMSFVSQLTPVFAPTLIEDLDWSAADFAYVGSVALFTSLAFPFIGRLADVLGVRWTATIGMVTLPLSLLAFSVMPGPLEIYVAIFIAQSIICVTTTATVYTRLVVAQFVRARGLALAISVSGSAVTVAITAPLLNAFVEAEGWRAGYQTLALITAIAGAIVFLLIPASGRQSDQPSPVKVKRRAREDYPEIFRRRAFWFLLGAMLLCNLPATIMLVQLKLLLLANGVSGTEAGPMLAILPIGTLAGRFVAGLALDRFRPDRVAFLTLALPSLGLFVFASSFDAPTLLTVAVFSIGFAFGAEGDILAYLVARHFGVAIYGSVMGLLTFATSFSTASGATLLGFTMGLTGGFDLYLIISGVAVLIGATLLLLLGPGKRPEDQPAPEREEARA